MEEKTETTETPEVSPEEQPPKVETPSKQGFVPSFFREPSENWGERFVDFGKYNKLTFSELRDKQQGYIQWLFKQSWFAYRYPDLHDYLVKNGECPDKELSRVIDPDQNIGLDSVLTHNQLQARYTNPPDLIYLVKRILGTTPLNPSNPTERYEYTINEIVFEHHTGVDLLIDTVQHVTRKGYVYNTTENTRYTLLIEFKPSVSNDYPEVIRQMRAQEYRWNTTYAQRYGKPVQVLVTQRYDGIIPLEQVKIMFGTVGIIFVQ